MTIKFVDENIAVSNMLSFESTHEGMVLAFKKDTYGIGPQPYFFDRRLGLGYRVKDGDEVRETLPPWPLRLEITPDAEESA